MKKIIRELSSIKINDTNKTFNGYYSADQYSKYMFELFTAADVYKLTNAEYVRMVKSQIQDIPIALDAYLPISKECIESMKKDAYRSPHLKFEADWYQTLYEIRNVKLYYYDKLMDLLALPAYTQEQQETKEEEYINYQELIDRYNFKGVKSVKDKSWRKKHNFYPCKQEGKGCAIRISVSLLEEWLRGNYK